MRVIVIGGGIGGLALAAGLRRHGVDVAVHERDTDLSATGGYHITLDGNAQAALAELVAPDVLERLLASASAVRLREPDVFWDHLGRELGQGRVKGNDASVDVDRITLRLLLAEAAGDSLTLGRTCTGFERGPDGTVTAAFQDGASADGDLLVGADGAHSVVARRLAGGPTHRATGLVGVSGRTPADRLDADGLRRLGPRSGLAVGPYGTALYVGFLDPVGRAVLDAPHLRASVTTGPTYIWGAMFPEAAGPSAPRALPGPRLRDATLDLLRRRGWGPRPLDVVERSEAEDVAYYRFNAATTDPRRMAPWPAGTATALGDAVHATPPTAGMGAGAAIRDAARLVREIVEVRAGRKAAAVAVGDFEADMRERGAAVVALALRTVHGVLATDTRLGAPLTRAALPLLAGAAALRGRRTAAADG
ncbi:FAD-dependent oxidoreductase [Nocardiopsis trehalosi]|jgi:2-polyprenyl-6-methoxyphenol hydroxylase-like FAD-dependent oxidoreductase|uniref:FAD-dependent oxidoreductase n=1 Tax=Nocardiopsis trehalosi TaxID=109329 RepID=UPI00082A2AE1|nr:FAD-dependent monooxygenase [Nocardiopsis trehalosi]